MRGDKKLYLVEFPADPSLRTWTMETHLPCDVGDLIFRPRSVQVGSGIVRAEITARTEAPSPYAARLTVEDLETQASDGRAPTSGHTP